jgi:hypothetical protein
MRNYETGKNKVRFIRAILQRIELMSASSSSKSDQNVDSKSNSKKSRLDAAFPWVGLVVSILTVLFGIWQFLLQQIQSNKQEFGKKQLELCVQATDAAARLAETTDPVEWEKARQAFWILYWGPLAIVEDQNMATAMIDFGKHLPKDPVPPSGLPVHDLDAPAINIAHAARNLIQTNWNVNLAPINIQHRD